MGLPAVYTWEGDGFRPLPRFAKQCDAEFAIGERYSLQEIEERSAASHAHYFAAINDGWASLPEHYGDRFPTPEHLRKWCLIKAGYSDSQTFAASSKAEALRLAAFIRPIDEFSVVTVTEATVTRFTAKSQSNKAMGKAEFQASKTRVLEIIAGMIGVDRRELPKEAAA